MKVNFFDKINSEKSSKIVNQITKYMMLYDVCFKN